MSWYAFESWDNGGICTSALYEGQEAFDFIIRHRQSNTFATLHEGGEDVKSDYEIIQDIISKRG